MDKGTYLVQLLKKPCCVCPLELKQIKRTKVQTLHAVTLHAITAYTDDTSIVCLSPLNFCYSVVSCLVLHVVWSVHVWCVHAIS